MPPGHPGTETLWKLTSGALQSRTIETTSAALLDDHNTSLPPLMNPAILEASDDLTNLSHLNEPAGGSCSPQILRRSLIFGQSCKRSDSDTRKKRFTPIVE